MSDYQILQLLQAGLCATALFLLCGYAVLVRGEERPPIVWFGVMVAGSAALAFGAVFLVTWEDPSEGEQRLEMATRLLREVPAVLIVGYGCLVQIRRYRGARNRRVLRRWFEKAPFVLSGGLLLAGVLGVIFPYPILDLLEPLPPMALLVDAIWMVPLGGYSALSAFVFFGALSQEMPGFRQRLQNLSAGVGMACICVIVWAAFLATGIRVLGTSAWLSFNAHTVADVQVVLVGTAALSLAVAVISYQARDRRTEAAERFLRFVEVVGEVSEAVENAPISRMGLSVEYASLLEAGGREFLALPEADTLKLDDAFRISVIWASRRHPALVTHLLHLARVYDEESSPEYEGETSRSPRRGSRGRRVEPDGHPDGTRIGGSGSSSMREVLKLTLSTLEETERQGTPSNLRDVPEWAQLCYVALADGAVFGLRGRRDVLEGEAVTEKVRDAYLLAKRKVNTVRVSSGPAAASGVWWGRRT